MDRHATDMRRCDPSRSGDRYTDTMFMTVLDKTIDQECLPTPRRTRQEYILPHSKYVEYLILIHEGECMKKWMKNKEKIPRSEEIFLCS